MASAYGKGMDFEVQYLEVHEYCTYSQGPLRENLVQSGFSFRNLSEGNFSFSTVVPGTVSVLYKIEADSLLASRQQHRRRLERKAIFATLLLRFIYPEDLPL